MTTAEYEGIIREAAKENDQLRDRVRELEGELQDSGQRGGSLPDGGPDDSPLCRGCFRWRLGTAGFTGLVVGGIALSLLQEDPGLAQALAASLTGNTDNAGAVKAVLITLTVIAPALAAVIEWKWTLYKHGASGLFRTLAEIWMVIKKGMGKDE